MTKKPGKHNTYRYIYDKYFTLKHTNVLILKYLQISIISNIRDNDQLPLLAPKYKITKAHFLTHHSPLTFNIIFMRNPM